VQEHQGQYKLPVTPAGQLFILKAPKFFQISFTIVAFKNVKQIFVSTA
jgi:hypothetical protein